MREFSSPPTYTVPARGSLADDIVRNGTSHPDSVAFSVRDGDGWSPVTAEQFLTEVRAVAKGIVAAGVGPGDRVGLLSKTRYEWTLVDYAIWYAGAVTVPIYETSSAEQVEWILGDSGARAVVVETVEHRRGVEQAATAAQRPVDVWCLEEGAVDVLRARGGEVSDELLEERREAVTPSSHATIIYTSGTTGRPKGCTLTHGNFMFEVGVAVEELDELFLGEDPATLLFLPLAHVFARVIQVAAVRARVRLGHSADVRHLVTDLGQFRPSFVLAVPRVFEKVFNTASQNAAADGRSRVFDSAVRTAIAHSRASEHRRPGLPLRIRHSLFDRLVYGRLRAALGGRCAYAVSGGAPLGERLGHFYRGIGVTVLEGYGLTETTAAITVNRPDALKIGTVGRPLGGTAVRVADDGELEVKGGQVCAGYWGNDAATEEVLGADGWLRTGDLAEIDDEGFVRITGRKKEILVTAGGKNVAPSVLEDRIRAHALVDQCMVVGDGRPFIAALVTLDPDAVKVWAGNHGKSSSVADLVDDDSLRAEVQSAVDEANKAVSKAESVRKFVILPDAWTEEGGQLTPSLKLRRAVVMGESRGVVEELYSR
ncbi:MAG: AMP-dependent synthetase/ligase [Solirubrobacterales bacterium]